MFFPSIWHNWLCHRSHHLCRHFPIGQVHGPHQEACRNLGGWFVADHAASLSVDDRCSAPVLVTHKHGRSLVLRSDEFGWTSIKGVGWTLGGPSVLGSPKDAELVFGLLSLRDAERELSVSEALSTLGLQGPRVLGYARLSDCPLPADLEHLLDVCYRSGRRVVPTLLYTNYRCPIRVADLAYYPEPIKKDVVAAAAEGLDCALASYVTAFTRRFGQAVGAYHGCGCINDSLAPDNVTLLAEVVDYEWFFVPGIPTPDGSTDVERTSRQRKEIIYAIEVGLELAALLHQSVPFWTIAEAFLDGYKAKAGIENVEWLRETLLITIPSAHTMGELKQDTSFKKRTQSDLGVF